MTNALKWPDDLGYGRIVGRFGYMEADDYDEDLKPNLTAATRGTVLITPSIETARYSGEDGPMLLRARPVTGVIDSSGYLCTPNLDGTPGERGIVLPATDSKLLEPSGFTYNIRPRLPEGALPQSNFRLPSGAEKDVATHTDVRASRGTVTIVDPSTAIKAQGFALQAETAKDEIEQIRDEVLGDTALRVHIGVEPPTKDMTWLFFDSEYDPASGGPLPTYTAPNGTIAHGELIEWEA